MGKTRTVALLIIFITAAALQADTVKGVITSLEGDIEVHRNGDIDEYSKLPGGLVILNLDLVKTGSDSSAEITLDPGLSDETVIKLSPSSAFYFDTVTEGGIEKKVISLLSGAVSVDPAPGAESIPIRMVTRSGAAAESAGNGFEAVTMPDSSTLVTGRNGPVVCSLLSGETAVADIGSAAEIFQGRELRIIDAGKDNLDLYKKDWIAEKGRLFRSVAFSLTKPVIIEYEDYSERFTLYYREIREHDRLVRKYRDGTDGFDAETLSDDFMKIREDSENMKKIIFMFDSLFFHIGDILQHHDVYPVKGSLHKKYDINDFMKDYGKSYKSIAKKASFSRQVLRLYGMLGESIDTGLLDEE